MFGRTGLFSACACHGVSRRQVLAAGVATAAAAALPARAQGRARVIDAHAHYYPQSFLDLLVKDGKAYNTAVNKTQDGRFSIEIKGSRNGPAPVRMIDLEQRISWMDEGGVSAELMSLTVPMTYWAEPELAHRLSVSFNDGLAEAHARYPERLFGVMTLPMHAPDRAVEEMARASKLPGMRAVGMGTNIAGDDLSDPMFLPVFHEGEELKL